jgi:hypothetical protein
MRTLELQMQITIDGHVAGPQGQLDWMTFDMDERLLGFINEMIDTSDTILLGRKIVRVVTDRPRRDRRAEPFCEPGSHCRWYAHLSPSQAARVDTIDGLSVRYRREYVPAEVAEMPKEPGDMTTTKASTRVRAEAKITVQNSEAKPYDQSMQRFHGKLGGRQGTFVLQGQEIVENGTIKATWFVVPGSGTDDLFGLRGEGRFEGDFGKGSDGTLNYWFE